jgi:hypothetical protein
MTRTLVPFTRPQAPLNEMALCAWIAQAAPGEALEYHRGLLAVDRDRSVSMLGPRDCARIGRLADRAYAAAEQGLLHLVQRRHGPDDFSYRAIARAAPAKALAALATLLEGEAA